MIAVLRRAANERGKSEKERGFLKRRPLGGGQGLVFEKGTNKQSERPEA